MEPTYPFRFCPYCGSRLERRLHDHRERPYCPRCHRWIYENPLPAVAALVYRPSQGVLLVQRGVPPKQGEWALPSGFLELDEDPEQAVLRELAEETGLKGTQVHLVGVASQRSRYYGRVVVIGYAVEAPTGTPVAGDDAAAVAFFSSPPPLAFDAHQRLLDLFLDRLQRAHGTL